MRKHLGILLCMMGLVSAMANADLQEIKQRGELRHIGIRYANFVTGDGDGLDVELVQGFAKHIGVRYRLVYSDFYNVLKDLLGKDVVRTAQGIALQGNYPVRGDMISAGFTRLPWREEIVLFSEPVFPSQVMLIARADSKLVPIKGSGDLKKDIEETKALIGKKSLLGMERTCIDPVNYGLGKGFDLRNYTKSSNLNEMVPALLNHDAELTLLDVPDVLLDLKKWSGKIKIIGPVSEEQTLASAFPKNSPELRNAFNQYLAQIKKEGVYVRLVEKYYPGIKRYFPEFFSELR